MHLRRLLLGLLALTAVGWLPHSQAAAQSNISQKVGVCDPKFPANCVKPAADGTLPITGTITASLGATASTAPTPVAAGPGKPLNVGLFTNLFVTEVDGSGNIIDWTTPATVSGAAASGVAVAGNPLLGGCRAATTAPTAVTDGQAIARQCGAEGANVTRPYAIKELMVRGSTGAQTGTGAQTVIASAGGSLKNYITAVQCTNSGASNSIVTLNDSATTVLSNPAGAGSSYTFPIPLATAAATALTANFGTASTSQYCSAQGYTGL